MRTNLAERLGYEPEEETRERQERLLEELRYREAMRRVAKTCCVWPVSYTHLTLPTT